ncbi:hypothetical protein KDL27_00980 [Pseudomonas syringae pv. syringae]|uniref:Uncharacterized protein n=3 Tax=Pseudomonas TaxID=286 RepID=A0AB35JK85_PSESY|nr:hypothetical protein [Pseudomonas syringae]MDC3734362.1 hypothetical protein [Pseudomonas syringae pv. syringae]
MTKLSDLQQQAHAATHALANEMNVSLVPGKLLQIRQHVADAMSRGCLPASVRIHDPNSGTARMLQEARRETVLDEGSAEEMRTVVITDKHGKFAVDPRTGEVLLADRITPEPASVGFHTVDGYVGIDTVWPDNATNPDALRKAMAPHDRWQDKRQYEEWRLLSLLDIGMGADSIRIMKYLCERVSGRNAWFGVLPELDADLSLPTRSRQRAFAALVAADLLRVESSSRGCAIKVCIHPWYAWVGDRMAQAASLARWIKTRPELAAA